MGSNGDVYYGIVADAYDSYLAEDGLEDAAFFSTLVADGGEPALELGCGTGRVLLELAEHGLDVEGIDSSADMLAICAAKAGKRALEVGLFEHRAQTMNLPRRYRTVYCPVATFMIFAGPGDAEAVLERVHDHLVPGGSIVLTSDVPWIDGRPVGKQEGEWRINRLVPDRDRRATLRLWERVTYDPDIQIKRNEYRNEVIVAGEVVGHEEHVTLLRWWYPGEFVELLSTAGFGDVRITESFSDRPAGRDTSTFVAIATRP